MSQLGIGRMPKPSPNSCGCFAQDQSLGQYILSGRCLFQRSCPREQTSYTEGQEESRQIDIVRVSLHPKIVIIRSCLFVKLHFTKLTTLHQAKISKWVDSFGSFESSFLKALVPLEILITFALSFSLVDLSLVTSVSTMTLTRGEEGYHTSLLPQCACQLLWRHTGPSL